MFGFSFLMVVLVALVGGAAVLIVNYIRKQDNYWQEYLHIGPAEFVVALFALGLIVAPVTYHIGSALSINEQLRYEEFYNGVETDAIEYYRDCESGHSGGSESSGHSNCELTYVCGSYTWEELYYVTVYETTIDSEGNSHTTSHQEPRYRTVRSNIYCPYLTQEFTYQINDSLPGGEHHLPGVFGDEVPTAWDANVAIPGNIPFGPPAEWLAAKARLDAGDPRPVTRIFEYDNYILAANEDMLLPYSEDVDAYLAEGILPEHTRDIMSKPLYGYSKSYADKLSFVGVDPPGGEAVWQEALMGFNGALGMTLRGDVHMVIIDASLVDSKVQYLNALKAYWLGDTFKRRTVAKNSIIIVVGVTDGEVVWGEASTGMPYGNEVMLESISGRLGREDVPLTPEALIGNPRVVFTVDAAGEKEAQAVLAESPGVLEQVILHDYPFARASMTCNDKEDGESCVGYSNLISKLQPSTSSKVWMAIVVFFISLLFWAAAAYFEWFGWVTPWVTSWSQTKERHQERVTHKALFIQSRRNRRQTGRFGSPY